MDDTVKRGSFGADAEAPYEPVIEGNVRGERGAVISECGLYRYRLHRRVTASDRIALFVMLNPSTADAMNDDPTIRRCMGFARAMDCGLLMVVNLFAFRATSPKDLLKAARPVGPDNDKHISECATETMLSGGRVICAWGANGDYLARDKIVLRRLLMGGCAPMSLGETTKGQPRHPLYLPSRCAPLPYLGRYTFCEDCPPVGYPTDKTRCSPCPRRTSSVSPVGEGKGECSAKDAETTGVKRGTRI